MKEHGIRDSRARKRGGGARETVVAVMLLLCVVVVAFWEIMSSRSRRPLEAFAITTEDFSDFEPGAPGWSVKRLSVDPDPIEPNILAFSVRKAAPAGDRPAGTVLVRLVHGYNMPECMRIKGYTCELIEDTRRDEIRGEKAALTALLDTPRRVQVWRLVSASGDVSLWVTSMLRVEDFAETSVDVRSMAFPRVGTPDEPRWFPRGLSLESFKHPLRNLTLFLRARWNASRADLGTFLGLERPAWASREWLTLVAATVGAPREPPEQAAAAKHVLDAHGFMYAQLVEWRRKTPPGPS